MPLITRLSTYSNQWSVCVPGICKAYVLLSKNKRGARIEYKWDDEGGTPATGYSFGEPGDVPIYGVYLTFDEESGRLVYLDDTPVTVIIDVLGRNVS